MRQTARESGLTTARNVAAARAAAAERAEPECCPPARERGVPPPVRHLDRPVELTAKRYVH